MPRYRRKGRVDIYEREKTDWAGIFGGIVFVFFLLLIIGSCSG